MYSGTPVPSLKLKHLKLLDLSTSNCLQNYHTIQKAAIMTLVAANTYLLLLTVKFTPKLPNSKEYQLYLLSWLYTMCF